MDNRQNPVLNSEQSGARNVANTLNLPSSISKQKLFHENRLMDGTISFLPHDPATIVKRRKQYQFNKYKPSNFKEQLITEETKFVKYHRLHGKGAKKIKNRYTDLTDAVAVDPKADSYELATITEESLKKYYEGKKTFIFVSIEDYTKQVGNHVQIPRESSATYAAQLTKELYPEDYEKTAESERQNAIQMAQKPQSSDQDNSTRLHPKTVTMRQQKRRRVSIIQNNPANPEDINSVEFEIYQQAQLLSFEAWKNKYQKYFRDPQPTIGLVINNNLEDTNFAISDRDNFTNQHAIASSFTECYEEQVTAVQASEVHFPLLDTGATSTHDAANHSDHTRSYEDVQSTSYTNEISQQPVTLGQSNVLYNPSTPLNFDEFEAFFSKDQEIDPSQSFSDGFPIDLEVAAISHPSEPDNQMQHSVSVHPQVSPDYDDSLYPITNSIPLISNSNSLLPNSLFVAKVNQNNNDAYHLYPTLADESHFYTSPSVSSPLLFFHSAGNQNLSHPSPSQQHRWSGEENTTFGKP